MREKRDQRKAAFDMLNKLPRKQLAFLPTPLHKLEKLSQAYGVEIYMKRDDLTGIEFGGNKTRKYEFILPGVLESGADYVLTAAAFQSNWCRQAVTTGIKCGFKTILYLFGKKVPEEYQGNVLINKTMGAEVHLIELNPGEDIIAGMKRTEETRKARIEELEKQGFHCQWLDIGGPVAEGHVAYTYAFGELSEDLDRLNMDLDDLDYVITAMGTGGTYTGLLTGKKLFDADVKVKGYTVSHMFPAIEDDVLTGAKDTAKLLGADLSFAREDLDINNEYIGEAYAVPSEKSIEATKEVARKEAVLLDPVYTAKAMAGLLDQIRKGIIPRGSKILFWHTGGLPAFFAGEKYTGKVWEE